jgi:hypothetical protein
MKRCHGRLHYDRKFQIFVFLIGYINVNKGVFCLIISYLQIKSYNVSIECVNCSETTYIIEIHVIKLQNGIKYQEEYLQPIKVLQVVERV